MNERNKNLRKAHRHKSKTDLAVKKNIMKLMQQHAPTCTRTY